MGKMKSQKLWWTKTSMRWEIFVCNDVLKILRNGKSLTCLPVFYLAVINVQKRCLFVSFWESVFHSLLNTNTFGKFVQKNKFIENFSIQILIVSGILYINIKLPNNRRYNFVFLEFNYSPMETTGTYKMFI